jgi:5-methyltetrahydropteroyltriglutamate--homocysteine methyltransferase
MATNYHAEHVGSLLRPLWLLDARSAFKQGRLTSERLREAEDRAALEAIELQRQAGMQIFTDGEVRRDTWMAGLLESTGGVVPAYLAPVPWHRDRGPVPGETVPGETVPGETVPDEETSFDTVAASEKVTRKAAHTSVEARFLAGQAPGQFKITMMSASMGGMIWQPGISDAVYPTPGDLVHDLVALQIEEIEGLIDQGVSWIQLDSLSYNQVFDPEFRAATGLAAISPERILDATIKADTELVGAAKHRNADVTVAMHICRGNNRSAWMAQGSYEPVAERLFGEVGVDRFLLEYDTERAGGFAPLRFVRPGTTVVLGLVSTKQPQLEPVGELRRRIEEASRYVPIDDLALTPQCGFASTSRGNQLTVDEERRKLELVVRTADEIWA